jgi:Protein of unknown function (DUF3617)
MKTPRRIAPLLLLAILLVSGQRALGADLMRAGQWVLDITSEKPGTAPIHQTRCVSAAEARSVNGRDANEALKVFGQMGADCKVTGAKFTGNTLSYSLSCPEMGFSAHAEMTLHGDTFDAVSTTTVGKTTSKNHTNAHRTGDCK